MTATSGTGSGTSGKNGPSNILNELSEAYSFLRDPILGKAIDEIAEQRRTIMKLKEENQILIETLRDLHMKIENEKN